MTIDEIIQGIQIIKAQAEWDYPIDWQIVLDGAIDIMHKYKKIEQLYYAWIATLPPKNAEEFLIKIGEVIVDKNDNLDIKQFERY